LPIRRKHQPPVFIRRTAKIMVFDSFHQNF
jgi:hypothetical protein